MSSINISGIVLANGSIQSGEGFKVTHDQTGLYTIFFSTPFSDSPAVVATQIYPNDVNDFGHDTMDNAVIVGIAADRFRVKTGNSNNKGDGADRDFSFVAVGITN